MRSQQYDEVQLVVSGDKSRILCFASEANFRKGTQFPCITFIWMIFETIVTVGSMPADVGDFVTSRH